MASCSPSGNQCSDGRLSVFLSLRMSTVPGYFENPDIVLGCWSSRGKDFPLSLLLGRPYNAERYMLLFILDSEIQLFEIGQTSRSSIF
jgi:hypothetical protein